MSDEFKEKNGELVYMMRPSALPILFVIAKHLRTSFNIRQKTTAAFSFSKVSRGACASLQQIVYIKIR